MKLLFLFSLTVIFSCHDGSIGEDHAAQIDSTTEAFAIAASDTNNRDDSALTHFVESTERIVSIVVDPKRDSIQMFWKDEVGQPILLLSALKDHVEQKGKQLVFAMNAGMYTADFAPLGLYIENGRTLRPINKRLKGYGNFYIQPGGIFYVTREGKGVISKTMDFKRADVLYATQSGPMLVINKQINEAFAKSSTNLNIRNGVGILPSGEVVMAISREPVSFYEFAAFFQTQGCLDALYLDGAISEAYYPAKGIRPFFDNGLGVLIGVIKNTHKHRG
jgi:uncharacterized protein YigE (DUF2233 family)